MASAVRRINGVKRGKTLDQAVKGVAAAAVAVQQNERSALPRLLIADGDVIDFNCMLHTKHHLAVFSAASSVFYEIESRVKI